MELRCLTSTDLDAVVDTFQRAFSDYVVDMKLSRDDLLHLMTRRGAELTMSAGAFDGEAMVAVMVVAPGEFESIPSAYDVFTGVVPEARGRGLARALFDVARPAARARGARRFLLEVIESNEPALRAYRAVGFKARRRLRVFSIDDVAGPSNSNIHVVGSPLADDWPAVTTRSADPSWQNDDASLRRVAGDVVVLRATEGPQTVGVALYLPRSRDVAQVHVDAGRADALHGLLNAARDYDGSDAPIRLVNVDAAAEWLCERLVALGAVEKVAQWEMELSDL